MVQSWQSKESENMKLKYSSPKLVNQVDLPAVVRTLRAIEKQQGILTPETVVASAEADDSPLHKYFTWDDTAAASRWRQEQARRLIRSVDVVFLDDKGVEQSCRAFVNVKPDEDEQEDAIGNQGYISIARSSKSGSYQLQVLEYAKGQLKSWKDKFGNYREFYGVAAEIDKL